MQQTARNAPPDSFDPEFFPTPRSVANRMIERIKGDARYYLEPSAGRGDIAETIKDRGDGWGARAVEVDCIESSPDLCAILRGKDLQIVGSDWLTYEGVSYYDAIVMNPPFGQGARHLLRAWDFMHDGEIVCLLNAETIRNPHTAERKRLAAIVEEHGDTEDLGACFDSAIRPTDVNVVMVYLRKTAKDESRRALGYRHRRSRARRSIGGCQPAGRPRPPGQHAAVLRRG